MRKILKGAGASTLVVATVLTGLGFGSAAVAAPSAAPSSTASASSVPVDGTEFKLVLRDATSANHWGQGGRGTKVAKSYTSRAEAERYSATLRTTAIADSFFYAKFSDGPLKGNCLNISESSSGSWLRAGTCGALTSLFHLDKSGRMVSDASGDYVAATPEEVSGTPAQTLFVLKSTGPAAHFQGLVARN